jgi:hypothetical protein
MIRLLYPGLTLGQMGEPKATNRKKKIMGIFLGLLSDTSTTS